MLQDVAVFIKPRPFDRRLEIMVSTSCRRLIFKYVLLKPLRALFALFVIVVFLVIIFTGDPDLDRNRIKKFQRDEKAVDKETFEAKLKEVEPQGDQNDPTKSPKTRTFLFIMILTSPKGTERRDAIRNTWLKLDNSGQYMAKFIIGGKSLSKSELDLVETEIKNYNDILIIPDLKDGYHELTNKVLQGFRWIDQHIDCSYILKADDDSFVRVDAVLAELEGQNEETKDPLYWGFFRGNANVKRRGQWAEKKWVLCDHYLPYANGGGYVLSSKLVHFISNNWDYFLLYNSEDVSVGTWLAPLKIHRLHDTRFDTEYRSRGCNNLHIVSHKQSIQDMFSKYDSLQKTGKLCEEEEEIRKSFEYDWKVPPSQCCKRQSGLP